jgi:hypothetical protein
MERLFKAIYFAGMVAEIVVRAPHERRRRQIPKTDRRVTRAERGLLAGLLSARSSSQRRSGCSGGRIAILARIGRPRWRSARARRW